MRVLIVDDMTAVRRELSLLLELSGKLQVIGQARDGVEAVRQAELLQPDVILMDLEMPLMDGYAATQQIKSSHPALRIIALSVHDNATARQRAQEAAMDDFIVKGAPLESIMKAIMNERSR